MFLHEAAPETARRMIDAWKEELWLLSKQFERDRQNELHRCASEGAPFSILVLLLARRLRHLAGDVEYLDELRAALDRAPAATSPQRTAQPVVSAAADDKRLRVRAASPSRSR